MSAHDTKVSHGLLCQLYTMAQALSSSPSSVLMAGKPGLRLGRVSTGPSWQLKLQPGPFNFRVCPQVHQPLVGGMGSCFDTPATCDGLPYFFTLYQEEQPHPSHAGLLIRGLRTRTTHRWPNPIHHLLFFHGLAIFPSSTCGYLRISSSAIEGATAATLSSSSLLLFSATS